MSESRKKQPRKPRKSPVAGDAERPESPNPSSRSDPPAQPAEDDCGASEREIAELAYAIWQGNGCPEGTADLDWRQAESRLWLRER